MRPLLLYHRPRHVNARIQDIYAVPGIDYIPIGTIKNYAKQAVKIEND